MKKSFLYFVAALAVAGTLLSCNKNMGADPMPVADEVSFGLSTKSQVGLPADVMTKATAAESLTSFKASVTSGAAESETNASPCWGNVVFTSDGEETPTYMASPKKYWPLSNPEYNVYAVTATGSSSEAVAAEAPDIVFDAAGSTITMAAAYDKDVACAYLPYGASGDGVAIYKTKNQLTFNHIFARLSTVKVTASGIYAISNVSIALVNAKTGGVYNLRTGDGQTDGTGWSSLVPADGSLPVIYSKSDAAIAAGANHTGTNNDLYVVPGDYFIQATWTASIDDYSQTFTAVNSSSAISLVGGSVNAIECNLTGNASELTFSVVLTPWGSNTISNVNFPTI